MDNKLLKKLIKIKKAQKIASEQEKEIKEAVIAQFIEENGLDKNGLIYEGDDGKVQVVNVFEPYEYSAETLLAKQRYEKLKARDEAGQQRKVIGKQLRIIVK